MGNWTLDPLQLAPVALAGVAYAARLRTLRRRGTPPPGWRVALFALGLSLLVVAFASPVAAIGEDELFSFHMVQHVLIGDLAPLCILAGLNGPMLRPLLALRPVERLRVLANPIRLDGERLPNRAGPLLGADTEAVLAEAGFSGDEIAEMKAGGVI